MILKVLDALTKYAQNGKARDEKRVKKVEERLNKVNRLIDDVQYCLNELLDNAQEKATKKVLELRKEARFYEKLENALKAVTQEEEEEITLEHPDGEEVEIMDEK